jgi:hypothetical protein
MTKKAPFLLLACFFMLALSSCTVLEDASKLQSYDFGSDQIPSLTSVVGERKVSGVEVGTKNGVQHKTYTYETSSQVDDMDDYYGELKSVGFLVTKDSEVAFNRGSVELGLNSADAGQMVLVTLSWESGKITVQVAKGEGEVTPF